MKWITSTDIKQWADRREAQSVLPELVVRLIRATASNITQIRFPSGDAVHLTGWDGLLETPESVYSIESGLSLWECGTNADPRNKANEHYDKRTKTAMIIDFVLHKGLARFKLTTPNTVYWGYWQKSTQHQTPFN